MKIGVNFSIDVKAIIKERMVNHTNGKTYLNMTAFIDIDNKSEYGDNGMITHAKLKDEQGQMKILGNAKVFWMDEVPDNQPAQNQAPQQQAPAKQQAPQSNDDFEDQDIPFN